MLLLKGKKCDGMGGYSMPLKCRWPSVLKESVKSTKATGKLWSDEFCCVRVIGASVSEPHTSELAGGFSICMVRT